MSYASGGLLSIEGVDLHVIPVYLYCGCRVDMYFTPSYAVNVGLKNWSYYMNRAKEQHEHRS